MTLLGTVAIARRTDSPRRRSPPVSIKRTSASGGGRFQRNDGGLMNEMLRGDSTKLAQRTTAATREQRLAIMSASGPENDSAMSATRPGGSRSIVQEASSP